MHWSRSSGILIGLLIIKSLGNGAGGREEKEIDLCIENRDRSRMQTALKRVLRGNGDGRASRRQRRRIRMPIPRHGLYVSARAQARDR